MELFDSPPASLLLSTALLPPIAYMSLFLSADDIHIDFHENYIKQSYRNRYSILTDKGLRSLSVPVNKVFGNHTPTKDTTISYVEPWPLKHWRTLEASYNKSGFFDYYKDELHQIMNKKHRYLIDLNQELLSRLLHWLHIPTSVHFSESYIAINHQVNDLRNYFSPKTSINHFPYPAYYQVFSDRQSFHPNLSILDLLFNTGPEAYNYLHFLSKHPIQDRQSAHGRC